MRARAQIVILGFVAGVSLAACNRAPGTSAKPVAAVLNAAKATATASKFDLVAMAKESNIKFVYRNGHDANLFTILESLGGGVAAADFDRDGNTDLCFAGGGSFPTPDSLAGLPVGLFQNLGEWRFADVSKQCLLDGSSHYNHGIIAGDYDNDGFVDLAVTGYGGIQLWRNEGDGTFGRVDEAARLTDKLWSSSAGWGDFNQDGALDLYIAHYVDWSFEKHPFCPGPQGQRDICPPREFQPLPDSLFLSNGDGTFSDATGALGNQTFGKGLGVLIADFDIDGDVDVYVANDTDENAFYINNGNAEFDESAILRGVAVDDSGTPNGSMGVDVCDFNRDGLPDIWVTNYEREAFGLYRNEGNGQFLHVSQPTGITALQGLFVGFGTVAVDVDRDADEDFFVSNGHVILFPQASPRRQLPVLLENENSRFRRVMDLTDKYVTEGHEGRGLVVSDLDNDGDVDFALSPINEPAEVLRNRDAEGNWLSVQLVGTGSNRDAVGARLVLRTSAKELHRQVRGGGSYLSTNDRRVFWGLGAATTIDELVIHWPSGEVTTMSGLAANQFLTLVEPLPDARVVNRF